MWFSEVRPGSGNSEVHGFSGHCIARLTKKERDTAPGKSDMFDHMA